MQQKRPITKTDLDIVSNEIKALRQLMENELAHQSEDIRDLKDWRDQFTSEDGPWRRMDDRVKALEYLARSVRWAAGLMAPIAMLATIEIARMIWAVLRGGP